MTARPPDGHLSKETLEGLALGRRVGEQVLPSVLDHLARRCPTCRRVLEAYPRELVAARAGGDYEAARQRASRRLLDLAGEREAAPFRMAELLEGRMVAEALAWVSASPRFHTWGLASVLTERSEEALEELPREARVWAQLAVAVAARLDPAVYGERVVAEARALAGVRLALAMLETGDDPAVAEHELALAAARGLGASDAAAIEAEIDLARARLDLAAGRFEEARARAEGVAELSSGGRFAQLRLEALLLLGRALRGAGEASLALSAFQVLRAIVDRYGELPWMERRVSLEIGETLSRLGEHAAGLRVLHALEIAEADEPGRTAPRRAYWAGVSLRGLGRIEEAEEALEAAWRGFAAEDAAVEALRALLDLAALYLEAKRPRSVAKLMEEGIELFRIDRLPRGLALVLFRIRVQAARGKLDSAAVAAARVSLEPAAKPSAIRPLVH
ncbi:MAG TPA: hypothetical protein VM599_04260 [Thermoanaerobaculia bacterium]|nr:hypothetical protein [Thermoanaerobaculia bacterium]